MAGRFDVQKLTLTDDSISDPAFIKVDRESPAAATIDDSDELRTGESVKFADTLSPHPGTIFITRRQTLLGMVLAHLKK